MKRRPEDFAVLGGRPLRDQPLSVGQLHFPAWERYEAAMRGICEREWYTNHGPLAVEAEQRLAAFLGVEHVVCVSNATVGLMMAAKALELDGAVIVPALTAPATGEALLWAGARPRFCDVERDGFHATPDSVRAVLSDDVQAILGVNLWGDVADVAGLEEAAREAGIFLFFDSAHGFGCAAGGRRLGGSGVLEVFSFHSSNVLNAAEGGCVATDDEELAARLRNIRSSYGAGRAVRVPITSNGRFSEAQAALTLMGLDDIEANIARNREQFDAYATGLAEIPGLRLLAPGPSVASNHQSAVVEVDAAGFGLGRDDLLAVLNAENVLAVEPLREPLHRIAPLADDAADAPEADRACATTLQLPLGGRLDVRDVEAIVALLRATRRFATRFVAVAS